MRDSVVKKEQHLALQHAMFDLRHDLREIIEKLPSLLLVLNKEGIIMLANMESWQREFGYSVCELIGKSWRAFLRNKESSFPDVFGRPASWGASLVTEWRTKEGGFKKIRWSVTSLDNGKMICVGNLTYI